ncbi:MAG: hypothetical protein G5Z42_01045 [Caldisphaeraceae archaeon]|nr:hypothetical protein [Caldisphaeraceae archaeon]MEB3692030.1 hypothetical protein [Caldisphaeraceae archaeon]MEB3797390.1 hypothetical protein [Caldisphaeraceae archaeon]
MANNPKKVLYISSSVGLGHVTRDYRLSKLLGANVTWVSAGRAVEYLKKKNQRIHEASYMQRDIGNEFSKAIKGCKLSVNPFNAIGIYKALKHNANVLSNYINVDDYDLLIGDEPWEFLMSGIETPMQSVLITDLTKFEPLGLISSLFIDRINRWVINGFMKFTMRFNVSLWSSDPRFINIGQLLTHDADKNPSLEGNEDYIIINIGGTDAALRKGLEIARELKGSGEEVMLIGGSNFLPDPLSLLMKAKAIITLAGYSSLVEIGVMKKRAIILAIDNHFEHEENAKVFANRPGYRVLRCSEARAPIINRLLKEIIDEEPKPPPIKDASVEIASTINKRFLRATS